MTPQEQLDKWLAGESIHNNQKMIDVVDDAGKVVARYKQKDGECCPDFSCCHPELKWDAATRQRFVDGPESVRCQMLMMSLTAMLSKSKHADKVHIAGQPIEEH